VQSLRALAPFVLALLAVGYFDFRARRLGLRPPGFVQPARRVLGLGALILALAVSSFASLASAGGAPAEVDYSSIPPWQLFALHVVLLGAALAWFAAGYAGSGASFADQVGLSARRPARELLVGALLGIGAWVVVIAAAWIAALVVAALGGEKLLPERPPGAVAWIAGQSVVLRAGLAFSAGTVEEIFFRGVLQPRTGIVFSTLLFSLAHLSYGEPFLLVGVTVLSLIYGLLVRWRQSVWAAIAAHTVFDLVQLLIVVPAVLREFGGFFA